MDNLKQGHFSSYSYLENVKTNEPNTNFSQLQPHSSHLYFPDVNQVVGQNRPNNGESNCTFTNLANVNDFMYWEGKVLRNEYDYSSKIQENFNYSKSNVSEHQETGIHFDRNKTTNCYVQRQPNIQWDPSCSHFISSNQNRNVDKMGTSFDRLRINKYENQVDRSKSSMNTSESNCMANTSLEDVNVDEFRGVNYEMRHNYNFEYCDDFTGLHSYLGLSTISNELSFNTFDQQTETSNGDSDIVVEETDEEIVNFTDHQSPRYSCFICNLKFIPMGVEFHHLTGITPVTMTSQQPVFKKLTKLIGVIKTEQNHICSQCLGLVNSIDYLQSKLADFESELRCKFQKTSGIELKGYCKYDKQITSKKSFSAVRCKYCSTMLSIRNYCYHHMKRMRRINVLCERCGMFCNSIKKFRKHICQTLNISLGQARTKCFSCFNCDKVFQTKTNLKEHQNFCLGILPHICNILNCYKKFSTTTRLKNHIKLKHDKKFIAICSICNIGFVKLSDYKSHKITHSTNKKFQCQKCDKCYKTQSNLNFHLKSHKKLLPYSCNICAKGFMRKEYLETHFNNHNNIKTFACPKCSKSFASQKNLDSHFKYHDGSIKMKVCNICGKNLRTSLNDHLRVHNNLREFECNQCEMKFNTKGTLAKHMKIKHVSISPMLSTQTSGNFQ